MRRKRKIPEKRYRQPSIYNRTEIDRSPRNIKRGIWTTLLVVAILGVIYVLIFSSLFRIERVEINELKYIDRGEVEEIINDYRGGPFFQDNLLFLYKGKLTAKIEQIAGVSESRIIKQYPHLLVVEIKEKNPSVVWQTAESRYLLDDRGLVYSPYEERFADIPLVIDSKNLPVEIGQRVATAEFCLFVTGLEKYFSQVGIEEIRTIETMESISEIKVTTEKDLAIYFDVTREIKGELNNLKTSLEEINKTGKKHEYIDLRIENRIYYK